MENGNIDNVVPEEINTESDLQDNGEGDTPLPPAPVEENQEDLQENTQDTTESDVSSDEGVSDDLENPGEAVTDNLESGEGTEIVQAPVDEEALSGRITENVMTAFTESFDTVLSTYSEDAIGDTYVNNTYYTVEEPELVPFWTSDIESYGVTDGLLLCILVVNIISLAFRVIVRR